MSEEHLVTLKVSTLASLMLYVKDKKFYDGDDFQFLEIKDALLKAENEAGKHPVYHLEFLPENPYTTSDGNRAKGRWCLWDRIDWELDIKKHLQDREASEKRITQHNNRTDLFGDICKCVATAVCGNAEDETTKTLASIITKTKNRILGRQYGVSEELMNKVWGPENIK